MDQLNAKDWISAVKVLTNWEKGQSHLDSLLEDAHPGRLHWLVMQVFRDWILIDGILRRKFRRQPRALTMNLLRLAVGELRFRQPDRYPKIVHNAVMTAGELGLSRSESGFINGVLRSVVRDGDGLVEEDVFKTHPPWLTDRWKTQFGECATRLLVEWNQRVPRLTVRSDFQPPYAGASEWDGYYILEQGHFGLAKDDLDHGRVYLQDPFARIPIELMAVRQGECILDLCASPGGKTRMLAEQLKGSGKLVAVDKPGVRMKRLRANIKLLGRDNIIAIARRVQDLEPQYLEDQTGSQQFDAILIDVPCSNTGVIQKRPDVKLRITEQMIYQHARQQLELLTAASRFVVPGGRLVYSTCSIDTEENAGVVEAFLASHTDWHLEQKVMSYPWQCNHDGGGAFLLTRSDSG